MSQHAAVKNAADPEQVKRAKLRDEWDAKNALIDLQGVLATPAGRRVMWRLLEHCKVFESIWHPSALIHANAGRQDVGHFIMAQIAQADERAFATMMMEASQAKNIAREADEVQREKKEPENAT